MQDVKKKVPQTAPGVVYIKAELLDDSMTKVEDKLKQHLMRKQNG